MNTTTNTANTPAITLDALLALDADERRRLAKDRGTDPATLRLLLLFDLNVYVRMCAAWNDATPPEVLNELLERGDAVDVLATVFENPNLDPDVLVNAARWGGRTDPCWVAVASNPSTPPAYLTELTEWRGEDWDDEWRYQDVIVAAVANPCTPAEAVEALVECGDEAVEEAVAERLAGADTHVA